MSKVLTLYERLKTPKNNKLSMLAKLVQHCFLVLCKVKHSLLILLNTTPNFYVVESQMWNIVDMANQLVIGPNQQMLDIVDIAIQVGRERGLGHSGQTMYKLCNANMCDITKSFSFVKKSNS